jgi:O-antigen ligase/Tfp pilus assembly protein PilF
MIAGVILAFTTLFNEAFITPKRFFLRTFTILLICLWSFFQIKYGVRLPSYKALYAALAYFVIVVASLFFSANILQGIPQVIDLACYIAVFIITISLIGYEESRKTATFLMAISIPVAIYSVIQHLGIDPVEWAQTDLVRNRTISTLGNPDFLSVFLAMVIPVAFCLSFRKDAKMNGIPELIVWGFNCSVLLGTYSRAGLLALAVGMVVALCLIGRKTLFANKKKLAAIVLIIVVAAGLIFLMESAGKTRHSMSERVSGVVSMKDNNVSTRLYLWQAAIKIIEKNPVIGTGPNTFQFSYLPLRYLEPVGIRARISVAESPHSLFLDIACSSGIIALLAFLAFVFITYYGGWLAFFKKPKTDKADSGNIHLQGDDRLIAAGFLAGISAYLAHHLFGYPTIPDELLFWIFAGFCQFWFFGKKELWDNNEKQTKLSELKAVFMVVIGFSAIALLVFNFKIASADYFFNKAKAFQSSIDSVTEYKWKEYCVSKAEENYAKALENDPVNAKIWLMRGKLYEQFLGINMFKKNNQGLFQQAYKSYALSIKLNPGDSYAHADIARLCSAWSDPRVAEGAYRQALAIDPYNVLFMTDLALLYQEQKKYNEAESLLLKVAEIYPEGAWVYGNLGAFYQSKGDNAKAVEYLNKALTIDPNAEKFRTLLDKIKK